jgi:putative Mg2+ transporter-C (MgtC) family protein
VTTAATLWIATVIGLCFGGGQVRLGLVATVLAFVTLFVLDYFDRRIPRQHRARLIIEATKGARLTEMPEAIAAKRFRAHFLQQTAATNPGRVHLGYEIVWRRTEVAGAPTELIELVNARFEVISFELISESPP